MIATGTPTGGATGVLIYNQWAASSWIREMRIEDRSGRQIGNSVNYYHGFVRLEYEMKYTLSWFHKYNIYSFIYIGILAYIYSEVWIVFFASLANVLGYHGVRYFFREK